MTVETLPPPRSRLGPIGWLRANLFSGIVNSIFTIILAVLIGWVVLQLGR
jgi:general L-amino acid transport system permease protein